MQRMIRTALFAACVCAAGGTAHSQLAVKVAMPINTGATPAPTAEPQGAARDEALLRSVGVSTDGAGLLTFFRLRSQGTAKPERLDALIEQLGDKSPRVAQKACGELAALGAPAIPALRQAVKDPDRQQTVVLARRCLKALEENPSQLSVAAARLLARLRPAGTAEALLAFLPVAEDDGVVEEVRLALAAGAYPDGKPDPALLKALQDELPVRRALAIDALCQNGITASILEQVPLRKLLEDPKPTVRLRAALALARAQDGRAVSALITLLSELPLEQARQAEDFLTELADDQAPKAALGSDAASRQKCRDEWAAWWKASEDGNRLLDELRKRTLTEARRQKAEELIGQLGDGDYPVRQKAKAEVRAMGAIIVPLLRQTARQHPDLEVRKNARECLGELERDKSVPLSPVTARLVALRKPAGAAEALLAYAAYADDEGILAEVQRALNAVAFKDGKADPVVVRGLSDALPARRAAAAEALCQGGDREHLAAVRKLLGEADPSARLKVALALAGARQRDAVPVLIDLIGDLPTTESMPAEEYLLRVAGDRAPADLPAGDGEGGENRKKRQEAWAAWWKVNGDRVALVPPAVAPRHHNCLLMVLANTGQVMELGPDRKVRWQINGLANPRDVQVLGPDRVLVVEWNAQRVSERNRKGEVLWQRQTPGAWPLAAERLRNGHTFIACPNKLFEVDRSGNEVYSINRPQNDVVMARRLRGGAIVLVTTQRQCIRMDTTGKELKSFAIQMVWQHNAVEIADNGHVLLPAQWMNRVIEYDANGKSVWEATAMQPSAATRLPGGNVWVAPQQWPAKVIEMDASGKQVSEVAAPNYVFRLRHR